MRTRPLGPLRRALAWVLLAAYLLLPFLKVRGQSALRIDVSELKLYFFGAVIWVDELFIVLLAVLFLSFVFIWVTLVFGRIWCGWICPQSVLVELSSVLSGRRNRFGYYMASFVFAVLTATATIWYFVPPLDFLSRLAEFDLLHVEAWGTAVMALIIWVDIAFIGRTFCARVCPYAMLQGTMFDSSTMVLGFDRGRADECRECDACVRACPVGIDLREGLQSACFACAGCRDACAEMLAGKDRPGLIRYYFGTPGGGKRIRRPASVMFLAASAIMLAVFVSLVVLRAPLDATVLPDNEFTSRSVPGGGAVSSFLLALSNRDRRAVNVSLSSEGVRLSPGSVELGPGEYKRIKVIAFIGNAVDLDGFELAIDGRPGRGTILRHVPLRIGGVRR